MCSQDIFHQRELFNKLSHCYYWEGMRGDIQKVYETCVVRVFPYMVKNTLPVSEPFECMGMDSIRWTPVQRQTGFPVTKWPGVFPVKDRSTTTVVEIFCWKHGVPAKIITT